MSAPLHRHWVTTTLPPLVAGSFGAVFAVWIFSRDMLDPTYVRWVFQGDWQWHFLGWQFFRHEPWQVPPGAMTTYLEPVGTAIGFTDSIPLVAFLLKPFSTVLPNPLQYLGLWYVVCFVLQGVFGSVLLGAWTSDKWVRALGGCVFVLMPALLARYAHPALCSHWVLLWALWLAFRTPHFGRWQALRHHLAVGMASGLLHPYLAVMVIALLAAASAKRVVTEGRAAATFGAALFAAAVAAVVAGWWASGLFTVTSPNELRTAGLGRFSMNLLGLVNPGRNSRVLPALPWISSEQEWEGYNYLGLALLSLVVLAAGCALTRGRRLRLSSLPLLLVFAGLGLFSLGPRVTFGDRIVADLLPYVGESSTFRASARFFWPVSYAIVAASIGVVATTIRPRVTAAVLLGAIVLQVGELWPWYTTLRGAFRHADFLGVNLEEPSSEWHALLPQFAHVRMYLPQVCGGPTPVAMPFAAYLTSLHGLGLNDGAAARLDSAAVSRECERSKREVAHAVPDDDTVYLVAPQFLPRFQGRAEISCRAIDDVPVCVSAFAASRLNSW